MQLSPVNLRMDPPYPILRLIVQERKLHPSDLEVSLRPPLNSFSAVVCPVRGRTFVPEGSIPDEVCTFRAIFRRFRPNVGRLGSTSALAARVRALAVIRLVLAPGPALASFLGH